MVLTKICTMIQVYGECEQPLLSSDVRRTAAEQPLEAVVAPPLQPPATFSDPPPVAVAVTDSKNEVIVGGQLLSTLQRQRARHTCQDRIGEAAPSAVVVSDNSVSPHHIFVSSRFIFCSHSSLLQYSKLHSMDSMFSPVL